MLLLSYLHKNSLVEFVFQVGHDGILQRAGFLSQNIFEFFDPTSTQNADIFETTADNADLVVFATNHIEAPIFKKLIAKLTVNSKTGLKYEDGGSLGYVVVGAQPTSLDSEASLKLNCQISRAVSDLVTKLHIGSSSDLPRVGRSCSGPEHRELLLHMMETNRPGENREEGREEDRDSHGLLVLPHSLGSPGEEGKEGVLCDDQESLNYKLVLLNLLLRGSRRTMIFTEASQSQVFLAGAAYGAKCGMSDPDNEPSALHYQLAGLHQHGLLHCWAQHGHDGLPQRAGVEPEDVVEVYNSWFDLPENPHNLELEKLRAEVAAADLLVVVEGSQADRASLTRQTLLGGMTGEAGRDKLGVVTISRTACSESHHSTLNIYSEAESVLPALLRSLDILNVPSSPRNVSCLHRAQALVPYDSQGRRTAAGKMMLSLEVGARVKLSPGHDHKLVPAYTTVKRELTEVQKQKLTSPGPKYGSVTRLLPQRCAFEVSFPGIFLSVLVAKLS